LIEEVVERKMFLFVFFIADSAMQKKIVKRLKS